MPSHKFILLNNVPVDDGQNCKNNHIPLAPNNWIYEVSYTLNLYYVFTCY